MLLPKKSIGTGVAALEEIGDHLGFRPLLQGHGSGDFMAEPEVLNCLNMFRRQYAARQLLSFDNDLASA